MFAFRRPALFSSRFFSAVAKNMEKHGVVPDVIDVAPESVAEVNRALTFFDFKFYNFLGDLSKWG